MKIKVGRLKQHGYYLTEGSSCGLRLVAGEQVLIYKTVKDTHYVVLPGASKACLSFAKVHSSWCEVIARPGDINIPDWIKHFFTDDEHFTTSINKRPIKV